MNYKYILTLCIALIINAPFISYADPATPDSSPSHVETNLRLEIDKGTDTVHFIQTNNDPDIITKTYILKHADPYELRPYLRRAIQSTRINNSDVKVEAVKYNDGTGALIVSAEDYKFDKKIQGGGMTIDEIVKKLDLPQITSSSGKGAFIYFPKYDPADALAEMLRNVGMDVANSPQENQQGKDHAYVDHEINAIWFFVTGWSVKYIKHLLELYDQPYPEVQVSYKVYEIDKENDDKIGMDWQAWKNGPGKDLFAASSKYASGWDFTQSIPGMPWVNNSHTQFIKFSPRWNTRFLDLLSAKGYAKVLTSGIINLVNGMEGHVDARTQFPGFSAGPKYPNMTLNSHVRFDNCTLVAVPSGYQITDAFGQIYMVSAVDMNGRGISVLNGAPGQSIIITRSMVGPQYVYYMKMDAAAASRSDTQFSANRQAVGHSIQCSYVSIIPPAGMSVPWRNSQATTIHKDAPRETQVHDLATGNDAFGFHLSMIPSVCGRATTLEINEYNTSLIGYESDGSPRTERSELNTKVMVSNDGSTFVIGGVTKKNVINSVSKLPWLGSLPGLGWLLGSESSVTKSARLVVVLTCKPIGLNTQMPKQIQEDIKKVTNKTKNATKKPNKLGFDQFLIDKDKMSLDKLP